MSTFGGLMGAGDDARYRKIMDQHKLPPLDGEILMMHWHARTNDWWAQTAEGWWYLRGDFIPGSHAKWKRAERYPY